MDWYNITDDQNEKFHESTLPKKNNFLIFISLYIYIYITKKKIYNITCIFTRNPINKVSILQKITDIIKCY